MDKRIRDHVREYRGETVLSFIMFAYTLYNPPQGRRKREEERGLIYHGNILTGARG